VKEGWKIAGCVALIGLLGVDVGLQIASRFAPPPNGVVAAQQPVQPESGQKGANNPKSNESDDATLIVAVLGAGISILTFFVIGYQTFIFRGQHKIMDRQAGIADYQAKIAHTQLMLTHRPRIIVRRVEMLVFNPEVPVTIRYTFVNTGETEAKLVEWSLGCAVVQAGANFSDRLPKRRPHASRHPITLQAGEPLQEDYADTIPLEMTRFHSIRDTGLVLLFYGTIAYRDGVGSIKYTGFVRRFNPRTSRFHLTDDPADEYQH
jgi:hypothetical protein